MTTLILVRHGQSQANAQYIFAGHSDFDLSELGKTQAQMAAEYLFKRINPAAIYSSDLLRAYHTATPIGEIFNIPVVKEEGFREIFAGKWESMLFDDIKVTYEDDFDTWIHDYSRARPTDGESTKEVYERIIPLITSIAEKHDGECVVIATHATVIRSIEAASKGFSSDETGKVQFCYNASINIYEYDKGTLSPIETNIVEHLGDSATALPKIINA